MNPSENNLLDHFYREVHALKLERPTFFRNYELGFLAELFLVNAVGTVLVIRVYLHLTGYPQIGGGNLHIAHMLWGGVFMTLALGLLLCYLDRTPRYIAAVVGGIGFGTFIDELGKFITSDNNYFFKPTFAFIYILFVSIFLLFRWVYKRKPLSRMEYLVNALELLQDAADGEFNRERELRLKEFIRKAKLSPGVSKQLRSIVQDMIVPDKKPFLYRRATRSLYNWYHQTTGTIVFRYLIALFFGTRAVIVLFVLSGLLLQTVINHTVNSGNVATLITKEFVGLGFFDWGLLVSTAVSNVLIVYGLWRVRESFYSSLKWYRWSVRVSIFFVNFFAFYHEQLIAVFGAVFDILLLYTLRFMIIQESNRYKNIDTIQDSDA